MSNQVSVTAALRLAMDHAVPPPLTKELRRADDFIRLAVVSGFKALAAAPVRDLASEARGIFIGTAFGPLETNFQSLGSLINDGEGQISPTLFSHSVYNSASGYAARLLDLRGPALTVTDYGWPFLIALEEARLAVASGRVERSLVLGVEVYSELLADAFRRSFAGREAPWHKGAVAWVLDRAEAVAPRLARLEAVTVTGSPCATGDYLTRAAECCRIDGRELLPDRHALAVVESLTELVNSFPTGNGGEVCWECSASFGSAELRLVP